MYLHRIVPQFEGSEDRRIMVLLYLKISLYTFLKMVACQN